MGIELLLQYKLLFITGALLLDIDWSLLIGQCMQESSGNPDAMGALGEVGLAQIFVSTAQDRVPRITEEILKDPGVNIYVQISHLLWIKNYFYMRGIPFDFKYILCAYNGGAKRIGDIILEDGFIYEDLPEATRKYAELVYKRAELFLQ